MFAMMMMSTGVAVQLVAAVLLALWIACRSSRGESGGEKHVADYDNHTQHAWLERRPRRHVFLPCDRPRRRGLRERQRGRSHQQGTMTSLIRRQAAGSNCGFPRGSQLT